jgi:hypothetical protein
MVRGGLEGRGVSIDANQLNTGVMFEYRLCVTACTDGTVENDSGIFMQQVLGNLANQYRYVIHAPTTAIRKVKVWIGETAVADATPSRVFPRAFQHQNS